MAGGLSIRGSIARYAHGENLSGILPGDVPEVLAELSERLEANLMQAKGKIHPGHWLRYELRLSKPGESLGGAATGADLAEGWPLERMAAMMWKEYKAITKQDTMKAPTGIRTAGEGKAYCRGVIMRAALQSGVVGDLVERVRNNNPGMASKELYRMRKALEKEAAGYGGGFRACQRTGRDILPSVGR